MNSDQERTEEATPRRRAKALAQGSSAKSATAGAAVAVALSAVPCVVAVSTSTEWIGVLRDAAEVAANAGRADAQLATFPLVLGMGFPLLKAVSAAGGCAIAAAVAGTLLCGPLGIATGALGARIARAAPSLKRVVSADSMAQAGLAALFAVAVATTAALAGKLIVLSAPLALSAPAAASNLFATLRAFWWPTALVALAGSALDVFFQRRRHAISLRMTSRQARDERAEHEGKPEIKGRRRSVSVRRNKSLRLRAIAKATAVIVNPRHVAVALRYAPPDIDVPIVVSRGAELAAAAVRAAAAYYDVPIVESAELARALYARADVDDQIPEDTYAAVAAVFAWLIRTRGRLHGVDR